MPEDVLIPQPCPFCLATDLGLLLPLAGSVAVQCQACGACGPLMATGMDAEIAWNTRPDPQLPLRGCPHCRQRFVPTRTNQLFCSRSCVQRGAQARFRARHRGRKVVYD